MMHGSRKAQLGITALGFLVLASVFGLVGFGGLKLAPLFLQKNRIETVLSDLKTEHDGKGTASGTLRRELVQRLYVEGITVRPEDVVVTPTKAGYMIGVQYDNTTPYIAGVSFLVAVDEQVEIRR
jgi:hypothetical protein